jgi:hypothetical protein
MYDIIYILLVEMQVRHTRIYRKLESSLAMGQFICCQHACIFSLISPTNLNQIYSNNIYLVYMCIYLYLNYKHRWP